ncbi:CDP-alcohol phosphatidyltransferase family protein [Natronorubrum sp. A-ect3]|uniref:CDP-alcohol phosphatidyltransferase family protein n=1 Tax=Natronorubrum sp. A-ect3 TaxID=3242698 RepID=UPI00359D2767
MSPDHRSADGDLEPRAQPDLPPVVTAVSRWLEAATGLVLLTALGAGSIAVAWQPARTVEFVGWVVVALAVVLLVTGIALQRTTQSTGADPLTFASWITLTRGAALATFVGVLAVGTAESGSTAGTVSVPGADAGLIAWMPALLFAAAGLLDAVDGAVARKMGTVTDLGARLDVELDGLTTLIGSVVVVSMGAASVAFLAVGAARYLYVGSLWRRRRRGRPVRDLPPSRVRGPLSGFVLFSIWFALVPITTAGQSILLTTVVAVPFLCNFLWDWLVVTTRVPR